MYAATGNQEIKERLDYVLNELEDCQEASWDGYLCGVPGGKNMWEEISHGNIRASRFDLNGKWVPLYIKYMQDSETPISKQEVEKQKKCW